MQSRKLKIYSGSGKNYTHHPQIIIQGKWLRPLGFFVGDKVTVTQEGKRLIVENVRTGMTRRKRLPWRWSLPQDTMDR